MNSCAISNSLSSTGLNVVAQSANTAHVANVGIIIIVQNKKLCLQAGVSHTYFAQLYSTLHKVQSAI